jgi:two-component system chemotaxis response regulator CheY
MRRAPAAAPGVGLEALGGRWRLDGPARLGYDAGMATRILVVDDSLVVARQLEGILRDDARFEIAGHAKNGAEALTVYASERPDIVFMDIVMPVMDGLQALRALLGVDAGARIIMVSSVGGVGEKASEALRLGACAVVSKPIDRDEIIRTLDRVLEEGEG